MYLIPLEINDYIVIKEDFINSLFYTEKILKVKFIDYYNNIVYVNKRLAVIDEDDSPFKISMYYVRKLTKKELRTFKIQKILK